ncbi:MAG: ThuA domain-containing protein [Chitinophagaceae bacterium]|nr:ThuA domain-containing protein [Chitinophagaceae bacterium]
MRRILILVFIVTSVSLHAQQPAFKVISFYTAKNDLAHISFVHEANRWFTEQGEKYNFTYDSTDDWNNLNEEFLSKYNVVLFFDTRPDSAAQREAFRKYMEHGGSWMGFHFAGFALTPSAYPQNWDWYHNEFIGAGQYVSNTWRPTSAILRVENKRHPSVRHLPKTFKSAPSEWYKWEKDLKQDPDINILLSVDPKSFPLGTKPDETWHNGYYPIAWTNKRYRMIYTNMGHNDMDYEGKTNAQLSGSFSSKDQNQFIIDCLLWLGKTKN